MEEAIKLATDEGWRHLPTLMLVNDTPHSYALECVFTDPLFWQALGKALGWELDGEYCKSGCGCVRGDGNLHDGALCSWEHRESEWKINWHNFIDHLAEGGTPDSFFKALLPKQD